MPTDPTPQAVSVCAHCEKTEAEHTDNPADYSNCGDFEPSPAPQALEGRLCGCIEDGKPCFKACGNDMTGWVCELETGLRQAPLVPNEELAQRPIRSTKGWMQERIRELESALTAAREERDRMDPLDGLCNRIEGLQEDNSNLDAELKSVREERDRAQEALRKLNRYLEMRSHQYMIERLPIQDMVDAALNPVSDRQPEGDGNVKQT